MNGVHDMGGMQGYGAIPIEADEPVWHSDWESKTWALRIAMGAHGKWNIDMGRHANERLGPAQYLNFSYYERWITSLADLLVEADLVSLAEIEAGHAAPGSEKNPSPPGADQLMKARTSGRQSRRDLEAAPKFSVGDAVRTNTNSPRGHTRLPAYARGRVGEIIIHHGAHVFPDSSAHGGGDAPQHLYAVRIAANELWGVNGSAKDSVILDLSESYLDHA
ncbi:MAG: nitrile hydratase subunit beta [Rhodospirillales bacterium]|jgi:nitrile hydratase